MEWVKCVMVKVNRMMVWVKCVMVKVNGVGKVCAGEGKWSDDMGKVCVMVKANGVKGG